MNDSIFDQLSEAVHDLDQTFQWIFFTQGSCLLQIDPERIVSFLQDYIKVMFGLMNVHKPDDIAALQPLHDLDFRINRVISIFVSFHDLFRYDLNRNFLVSLFVDPEKDLRKGPWAQFVIQEKNILPYSLFIITHNFTFELYNQNLIYFTLKLLSTN